VSGTTSAEEVMTALSSEHHSRCRKATEQDKKMPGKDMCAKKWGQQVAGKMEVAA